MNRGDKKIIILNGYPGAGKTTFSKIISELKPTIIRSSIDFVKEIAIQYYDWDGQKTEESRKFLSDTKHFLLDYTKLIEEDLAAAKRELIESSNEILIVDIREIEEIKKYQKKFNATTVFLHNSNIPIINSNISDAQVENFKYDFIIDNNKTITELREKTKDFINKL